jgi:cathepsin L
MTAESSFRLWMQKHNKDYNNDMEFQYRLGVYRQNLQFIEEHNRLNKGFTVAINKFADMTNIEFAAIYNGLMMSETRSGTPMEFNPLVPTAATVDWRTKGAVTPIKDQQQCGSCWAFSTTGSTEGAYFLKTGKLVSLSEQQLVDCSGSYGNYGCDGGLMDNAFKYIIANTGIDTESSYPYTAEDGSCVWNPSNRGATLTNFQDVASGDEDALTKAINGQPVSVAIDASQSSFQFYSGGIYYEPNCSSDQLDHGVLAVGYGSDGGDYYIVKNSWGTSWGDNGYIMMSRGKSNNCGIATAASFPTA